MEDNIEQSEVDGKVLDIGSLYERLQGLEDKRHAQGKRYSLALVLVLVVLAKLCGEDNPYAISQWARWRSANLVRAFALQRQSMPGHNTYRRVLRDAVDVAELQAESSRFLTQAPESGQSVIIAIDGKTLRGTIQTGQSQGVHLLAAYLPTEGIVLMQVAVDKKENEIVAAPRLLDTLDLRDKVVCADAMLTQRALSLQILAAGGDFIWVVKQNQAQLHADIQEVFDPAPTAPGWSQAPRDQRTAQTRNSGHGRIEHRRLTASTFLNEYSDWPGIAQVFRLEREVVITATGEHRSETVLGITSLSPDAAPPQRLIALSRAYWGIENGLHYRRDKTLNEDATKMGDNQQAQSVAILNNLVIGITQRLNLHNLAAARRYFAAHLDEALNLVLARPA